MSARDVRRDLLRRGVPIRFALRRKTTIYRLLRAHGNPPWLAAWKALGHWFGRTAYIYPSRWAWGRREAPHRRASASRGCGEG